MRIISFIEDREVIQAIRKHLGLWLAKLRPTPKAHAPPAGYVLDPFSQIPLCTMFTFIVTPTIPGTLTFSRNKDGE